MSFSMSRMRIDRAESDASDRGGGWELRESQFETAAKEFSVRFEGPAPGREREPPARRGKRSRQSRLVASGRSAELKIEPEGRREGYRFVLPNRRSRYNCDEDLRELLRIGGFMERATSEADEDEVEDGVEDEVENEVEVEQGEGGGELASSGPGEAPGARICDEVNRRLLEHQREGVRFLYSLYVSKRSGILADDMGLGKTVQAVVFVAVIKSARGAEGEGGPVLVVAPASTLQNWQREFARWTRLRVFAARGKERKSVLHTAKANKADVVLAAYDALSHVAELNAVDWSCAILDEVHRIKTRFSKLSANCARLRVERRYGLTGTVVQNNFEELWTLCHALGCRDAEFGDLDYFRRQYVQPIREGRVRGASDAQVSLGRIAADALCERLKRFVLRRTKLACCGDLPPKEERVVLCKMAPLQLECYRRLVESWLYRRLRRHSCEATARRPQRAQGDARWDAVGTPRQSGQWRGLALSAMTKLQQLSNHVSLLVGAPKRTPMERYCGVAEGAEEAESLFSRLAFGDRRDAIMACVARGDDAELCGKLRVLSVLLERWKEERSKVLVFSGSTRMMDILSGFFRRRQLRFARIDGSTPVRDRQRLVDSFNRDASEFLFLASIKVCGVGLNLCGANVVVIFEPHFNVALDMQASDRAHRIGQDKATRVYRLVSANTIEELTYRRQLYKQQMANIATGVEEARTFDEDELFGSHLLFSLLEDDRSADQHDPLTAEDESIETPDPAMKDAGVVLSYLKKATSCTPKI
ncbi:uncharacterized protein LOC126324025 [Schistocerca gregaria]|uniref:uncharacterized protein LOC126324025 n=1 Tax=Schistocerca gregaria TaxID=7010 RepID=UPI00211F3CE5|nr:uncharacterized protein LOC126324025 [Schistocerca gregaria]